jgi:hypothetical protein
MFVDFQKKLKEEGINVAIPARFEIQRTFEEFNQPLGLSQSNGNNGHHTEADRTADSRDPDVMGRLIEEADTTVDPADRTVHHRDPDVMGRLIEEADTTVDPLEAEGVD